MQVAVAVVHQMVEVVQRVELEAEGPELKLVH
jgi:hypothetical protein